MTRFNAQGNRGGGRGGGRGAAPAAPDIPPAPPPAPRDNRAWLAALTSLDFDALSRNAQVDYLYMRWRAETDLAHETETIPPGPAFRPDDSKIQGKPRGREGLISDLRDNSSYAEQLIALANRKFAWCGGRMKKASRWASATTGRRRSRR